MPLTKERYHGAVVSWTFSGHGFIYDRTKKQKVFAHFTDINEKGWRSLKRGQIVNYKLTFNVERNTWVAKNIKYGLGKR